MANEYLRRTPTSTGNNRVFTWSGWVKRNIFAANYAGSQNLFRASGGSGGDCGWRFDYTTPADSLRIFLNGAASGNVQADGKNRDPSSWMHVMLSFNSTLDQDSERARIYVNGVRVPDNNTGYPTQNYATSFNERVVQSLFAWDNSGSPTEFLNGEVSDVFFIDGQALTPDVFGFNKQGKGYISVGSIQATDFRPGQWVPKTPRVIKTEINRRGGFGVNGFYLPMNDSRNFGADFHGEPNSIITLNEKLPQPRVGVASTASVGLGYTDVLRADPYAANLVLAIPGVIGGQGSGYGDYSANIKGSGSNKTVTANGNAGVALTASYYGSALSFDGSGDYLSIANNSDFGLGSNNFTIEYWLYHNAASSSAHIFDIRSASDEDSVTAFYASSTQLRIYLNAADKITVSSELKQNQWTHHAIVRNGSTLTFYQNGVAAGINTTSGDTLRSSAPAVIGAKRDFTSALNGYLQDFRIYKGVAKYKGGFDVPRPYTPVGIATWRQVPDTTANNFATLNPLQKAVNANDPGDFTDGNLTVTYDTSTNHGTTTSNVGIGTTGKWYVEARINSITISGGFGLNVGVTGIGRSNASGAVGFSEVGVAYENTGVKRVLTVVAGSSTTSLYGSSYTTGDIIGIGVSNGDLTFYKNGTSQGIAYTGITTFISNGLTDDLFFGCCDLTTAAGGAISWNFGQNPTFSGNTTAGTFTDTNSKGLFKYQPPSGFLALCEDNLPTPAISDPGKYFKTVLYTGTGASRNVVGVGFTVDFAIIKSRNTVGDPEVYDLVRGSTRYLLTDTTNVEGSATQGLVSFDSDGFSLGTSSGSNTNVSGTNYVAWCWRAGAGTTSTNTNGSITSVVSVNQDAGFSIVSYRSNGTSGATVGHQLNKTPSFIIVKMRSSQVVGSADWAVYHKSLGATKNVWLNATNGTNTSSAYWNNTEPTSSVFSLGNDLDTNHTNGYDYISYCWAEIEGFSKFGSYVGNGNADGPFVYCGFKPALVTIKRTAGAADWVIHDSSRTPTNPSDTVLRPNTSDVDLTASTLNVDFLSNGFKIRNTNASYNNAETYIFAAWAESPFQTANSK